MSSKVRGFLKNQPARPKPKAKAIVALPWPDGTPPTTLFHGTSSVHLPDLLANGLRKGSYWGTERVALYYAEVACDEVGGTQVLLEVPFERFDRAALQPDTNSIAEPLTYTLRTTEDDVIEAWSACEGTWEDTYKIVESVRYNAPISVAPHEASEVGAQDNWE